MTMRTIGCAMAVLALGAVPARGQSDPTGPAGTWQGDVAPNPTIVLKVDGTTITGTVAGNATGAGVNITEGSVNGNSIVLKVQFPNNGRTVTFNGTLDGDEIRFMREVVVPKGAEPGGAQILGANGPPEFRVYRIIESSRWTGTARNAPTPRNPSPNPNPRPIGLTAKKTTSPHWRWAPTKHIEVRTFSLANQSLDLTSYELEGDKLLFTFNQGQNPVTCQLARRPEGRYEGTCANEGGGGLQLVVDLTPPDVAAPAAPPAPVRK